MSNLTEHAIRELELVGDKPIKDDMLQRSTLALIELFGSQGHSGFTAPYALALFNKLANYEPLTPIEDNVDDWKDVSHTSDSIQYQHRRCSNVFKTDGKITATAMLIFRDDPSDEHSGYTCAESNIEINLPWDYKKPFYLEMSSEDFKNLSQEEKNKIVKPLQ